MNERLQEIGNLTRELNDFESALRESEYRNKALADATFESILISIGGCCIDANKSAYSTFGYDSEELMGKYLGELVADD